MSADLIVYVEHKTKDGWERLGLYDKNGKDVTWRLFDNTAMDILFDGSDCIEFPRGLPDDVLPDMEEHWRDCESLCTYFDWCELTALARTPEAMQIDWEKVEECGDSKDYPKYNALEGLVKSIGLLLECNGAYTYRPYEVRVICCLSV